MYWNTTSNAFEAEYMTILFKQYCDYLFQHWQQVTSMFALVLQENIWLLRGNGSLCQQSGALADADQRRVSTTAFNIFTAYAQNRAGRSGLSVSSQNYHFSSGAVDFDFVLHVYWFFYWNVFVVIFRACAQNQRKSYFSFPKTAITGTIVFSDHGFLHKEWIIKIYIAVYFATFWISLFRQYTAAQTQ